MRFGQGGQATTACCSPSWPETKDFGQKTFASSPPCGQMMGDMAHSAYKAVDVSVQQAACRSSGRLVKELAGRFQMEERSTRMVGVRQCRGASEGREMGEAGCSKAIRRRRPGS